MEQSQLESDVERLLKSLGQLPKAVGGPSFIAVSGLPGTGKTHFCNRLAERVPLALLESDALRKTLFPKPTYSREESARLFQAIHTLIERLLKRGIPLILDATNLSERYREQLYAIADRLNARLVLVQVKAPARVVRERLDARVSRGATKSDADWEIYQKMKPTVEKIHRHHFVVDTSKDITLAIDKVVREINR
ncbi:MAG: ATP-binding protein [Chloroflexi bacterium]|nr:ATP-binding protein [Chloroflexota bacterium]